MSGDRFDEILNAALQSEDWRAVGSIMYSDGRFASRVATADVEMNYERVPMIQLTINVGGMRAAGFDDIGGALSIAEWRPNKQLGILDSITRRVAADDTAMFTAGLAERANSGLPARLKGGPHSGLHDAVRHHNATRYDGDDVMQSDVMQSINRVGGPTDVES